MILFKILIFCSLSSLLLSEKPQQEHGNDKIGQWNGTWFPENPNKNTSTVTTNTWNGKWFPHIPNETDSQDVKKMSQVNINNKTDKMWNGKWFPHEPYPEEDIEYLKKKKHSKQNMSNNRKLEMGIPDPLCDDAKSNLFFDFDPYDITYHERFLCTQKYESFMPNINTKAHHLQYHIPNEFPINHICMNESIEYTERIPTYGNHRRLWAMWGEYKYLPKQRWIHNLEHGGIVMLYHPCALHSQVNKLKKLVKNCLYRHIITPYEDLLPDRPMAIVAWGNSLEMSVVSMDVVVDFIKKFALQAPEKLPNQGQYSHMLIENATVISDYHDNRLCPYNFGLNHNDKKNTLF